MMHSSAGCVTSSVCALQILVCPRARFCCFSLFSMWFRQYLLPPLRIPGFRRFFVSTVGLLSSCPFRSLSVSSSRARPAQGARVPGGCSLSPLRFRVPRALARRSRLLGALASGELGQLCSVFLFRCQLDQLAFNRWFSLLKRLRAPVPPRLLMLVPRASYLFSDHNLYFSSSSNFPLSPTLYASGFPSG